VAGIPELIAGALLVTTLAVIVDLLIAGLQRRMTPRGVKIAEGKIFELPEPTFSQAT
jgi:ABC-type proline/glycine betaine transport system permease subunit